MPGMNPSTPTSRKTTPISAAADCTGVRSLIVTSLSAKSRPAGRSFCGRGIPRAVAVKHHFAGGEGAAASSLRGGATLLGECRRLPRVDIPRTGDPRPRNSTREVQMRLFAHLSYANVIATLALFLALGGTAVAGTRMLLTGADIQDHSLTGADIKKGSIGAEVLSRLTIRELRSAKGARGATGAAGRDGSSGA